MAPEKVESRRGAQMGVLDGLREELGAAGLRPSARRGQNFLIDANQARFIAGLGNLSPGDAVLEVGPGTGLLTRELAATGCRVLAVELDRGLHALLGRKFAGCRNLTLARADILEGKNSINPEVSRMLGEMLGPGGGATLKCVSNLPYSAGTPFVMNLPPSPLPWKTGVFLLQREVAERIAAQPGSAGYGAISIYAALAGVGKIERIVPPDVFWPRPKVDSAVLTMAFKPPEERTALPWPELRLVTNAVFTSRRKNLRNALKSLCGPAILEAVGVDPGARGETLEPGRFLELAEAVRDSVQQTSSETRAFANEDGNSFT